MIKVLISIAVLIASHFIWIGLMSFILNENQFFSMFDWSPYTRGMYLVIQLGTLVYYWLIVETFYSTKK